MSTSSLPTEHIHLGKTRPSQRNNPLLVRPELGKIRRPTVNLPSDEFVYGRPAVMDAEGAGAVISRWKEHEPAPIREKAGRDFVALNRASLKAGAVTMEQQHAFRQQNDIRLKIAQSRTVEGSSKAHRGHVDANVTYGRQTEPSIPLSNIISNVYQEEWLQAQHKKQLEESHSSSLESANEDAAARAAVSGRKVRHTKASAGHTVKPGKAESTFKMRKFQNVPPRVSTFNHQTSKVAAAGQPGAPTA